jgi:hypothetical protein
MIYKGKWEKGKASLSGSRGGFLTAEQSKQDKNVVFIKGRRTYTLYMNKAKGGASVGCALFRRYGVSCVISKDGNVTVRIRAFQMQDGQNGNMPGGNNQRSYFRG